MITFKSIIKFITLYIIILMENILNKICADYEKHEGNIISLLQDIQNELGYIPEDAVLWFSKKLDIPASRFFGIATFYAQFHLSPRGKNIITTCCGTACHVKGSERLINGLIKELDLPEGQADNQRQRVHTGEGQLRRGLQYCTCSNNQQ